MRAPASITYLRRQGNGRGNMSYAVQLCISLYVMYFCYMFWKVARVPALTCKRFGNEHCVHGFSWSITTLLKVWLCHCHSEQDVCVSVCASMSVKWRTDSENPPRPMHRTGPDTDLCSGLGIVIYYVLTSKLDAQFGENIFYFKCPTAHPSHFCTVLPENITYISS